MNVERHHADHGSHARQPARGLREYKEAELTLFPTDDLDDINFTFGAPGRSLLPTALMAKASAHLFEREDSYTSLQYGPSLGDARFLDTLADFLSGQYGGDPVRPTNLSVTNGASGSFSNILSLFTNSKTRVIMENPTYFLAIRVLEDHGHHRDSLMKVEVDESGLRTDQLEALLEADVQNKPVMPPSIVGEKRFPYLLFLVPTYSNPTGLTLSLERRKELVRIARKYDVLVVCDDVYQLIHFYDDQRPPPRVVALDLDSPFGNVISNQSFSKVLAPGLRLGWVEAAPGIINQYLKSGLMYSGGSPAHAMSGIVTSAMTMGLVGEHLSRLRTTYATRMNKMCDYLDANMPPGITYKRPTGGFFVWLRLPPKLSSAELLAAARAEKVGFAPGNAFSSNATHGNYIRLTFSFYEEPEMFKGLERLVRVLKRFL